MANVQPEQSPWQVVKANAPQPWVIPLLVAFVLAIVRLSITLAETERSIAWTAQIIRQDTRFLLIDESYGGLRRSEESIARVTITARRGTPVASGFIPTVTDSLTWDYATLNFESLSAEAKAFIADKPRIAGVVAEGLDRQHADLNMGGMVLDGRTSRTRVSAAALTSAAWLLGILGCVAASGLMWGVPRVRARRRAAAIAKGECPGCHLPMGTLRSRTCPQCKMELSAEEFNAIVKHWRK